MTEEKLVPELRFQEFEGEWEKEKLGTIAKIKTGNSNVQDSVKNGKYNFFDRSVDIKKMNKFDYDEEAIIYPGEGSQFFPQYYKGKYALHQRAYSITSDKIDMRYLNYMLMQRNNHFLRMAVGSTVKSLRMDNFEKCPIYLTVKAEQEKIGNFFSKIDKKIELQEQLIENLEEQKKGLMQKIFNQEVRFKDETGKDYPEWEKEIVENIITSIPVRKHQILSGKIKDKGLYPVVTQSKEYIDGYFNDIKKVCFEKPIILFGDHTTVFKYINFDFIVGGDGVKIFKVNPDKYNLKFIYYNLIYKNITMQGYRRHFSLLREIYLMIPNLKEQKKIAEFLSLADKRIDLEKEQLENYKEYKKGLMQRMFI